MTLSRTTLNNYLRDQRYTEFLSLVSEHQRSHTEDTEGARRIIVSTGFHFFNVANVTEQFKQKYQSRFKEVLSQAYTCLGVSNDGFNVEENFINSALCSMKNVFFAVPAIDLWEDVSLLMIFINGYLAKVKPLVKPLIRAYLWLSEQLFHLVYQEYLINVKKSERLKGIKEKSTADPQIDVFVAHEVLDLSEQSKWVKILRFALDLVRLATSEESATLRKQSYPTENTHKLLRNLEIYFELMGETEAAQSSLLLQLEIAESPSLIANSLLGLFRHSPMRDAKIRTITRNAMKKVHGDTTRTLDFLVLVLATAWAMYHDDDVEHATSMCEKILQHPDISVDSPSGKSTSCRPLMIKTEVHLLLAHCRQAAGSFVQFPPRAEDYNLVKTAGAGPIDLALDASKLIKQARNLARSSDKEAVMLTKDGAILTILRALKFLCEIYKDIALYREVRLYAKMYFQTAQENAIAFRTLDGLLMLAENDLACDEEGMATVKLRDSEELLRPFLESSSKLVRGQQKQDGTKRSILSTAEDPSASPAHHRKVLSPLGMLTDSFQQLPTLWLRWSYLSGVRHSLEGNTSASSEFFVEISRLLPKLQEDVEKEKKIAISRTLLGYDEKHLMFELNKTTFDFLRWQIECYGREAKFDICRELIDKQMEVLKNFPSLKLQPKYLSQTKEVMLLLTRDPEDLETRVSALSTTLASQTLSPSVKDQTESSTTPILKPSNRKVMPKPVKKRLPPLAAGKKPKALDDLLETCTSESLTPEVVERKKLPPPSSVKKKVPSISVTLAASTPLTRSARASRTRGSKSSVTETPSSGSTRKVAPTPRKSKQVDGSAEKPANTFRTRAQSRI